MIGLYAGLRREEILALQWDSVYLDTDTPVSYTHLAEAAYDRRMYRYKAHYSLDSDNGIENAVLMKPQTCLLYTSRCV